MQITVFGASGNVGQQVVNLALEQGYDVTAFVHSHNPFKQTLGLTVVRGDINDADDVKKALKDSTAAISTLGSWHTKYKNVLTSAMRTIIPALNDCGCRRLITLTGGAAFYSRDRPTSVDKLNHMLLGLMAPKILADGEEHLRLLEASNLDWTCIRSPVMTKSASSKYRLSEQLAGPFAVIPRLAVSQCLIDQLNDTSYLGKAPLIYHT